MKVAERWWCRFKLHHYRQNLCAVAALRFPCELLHGESDGAGDSHDVSACRSTGTAVAGGTASTAAARE
jgi:hypothetical protein